MFLVFLEVSQHLLLRKLKVLHVAFQEHDLLFGGTKWIQDQNVRFLPQNLGELGFKLFNLHRESVAELVTLSDVYVLTHYLNHSFHVRELFSHVDNQIMRFRFTCLLALSHLFLQLLHPFGTSALNGHAFVPNSIPDVFVWHILTHFLSSLPEYRVCFLESLMCLLLDRR
jgi:hypothetical protein